MPYCSYGETCVPGVKRTLFDSISCSLFSAFLLSVLPFKQPGSFGRRASALAELSVVASVEDAASGGIVSIRGRLRCEMILWKETVSSINSVRSCPTSQVVKIKYSA